MHRISTHWCCCMLMTWKRQWWVWSRLTSSLVRAECLRQREQLILLFYSQRLKVFESRKWGSWDIVYVVEREISEEIRQELWKLAVAIESFNVTKGRVISHRWLRRANSWYNIIRTSITNNHPIKSPYFGHVPIHYSAMYSTATYWTATN